MSVLAPPPFVAWQVEHAAPGGYALFLARLRRGVTGSVTFTSWWRDPASNAAVGGDAASQHLIGWAVDVVPAERIDQLAASMRSAGLVAVEYSSHVHVQLLPAGLLARSGLVTAIFG